MPAVTLPNTIDAGTAITAAELQQNFVALLNALNGTLDGDNLAAAFAAIMGASQAGVVRRGKSIIATEESRSSATLGLLPTPDRVSGVVLPTDGLIVVGYQAMWKEAVAGQGSYAAISLGANPIKAAKVGTADPIAAFPVFGQIGIPSGAPYLPLASHAMGLYTSATGTPAAYNGDVTTGQVIGTVDASGVGRGGPCFIFASAGTYDVSVQFRSDTAGAITVKNRKLWVWTLGF